MRDGIHARSPAGGGAASSIRAMKMIYVFAAILACSLVGALVAGRALKTTLLVATGALSLYGIFRLIG